MMSVEGKLIIVIFRQELINWLNKEYPQVNWIAVDGPVHTLVDLHNCGEERKVKKYGMDDFYFGPEPFFIDFYNIDDRKEDYEKLMRSFAEWILKMDEIEGSDVYLMKLEGRLKLVEDDDVTRNKTCLRTCGVEWHVTGTL